jgi:hypothetical protein
MFIFSFIMITEKKGSCINWFKWSNMSIIPISLSIKFNKSHVRSINFAQNLILLFNFSTKIIRRFFFHFIEFDYRRQIIFFIFESNFAFTLYLHRTPKTAAINFFGKIISYFLPVCKLYISDSFVR